MRRAWQSVWWLSWLNDGLLAVALLVGGPAGFVIGFATTDWKVAALGALAILAGLVLTVSLARDLGRTPSGRR